MSFSDSAINGSSGDHKCSCEWAESLRAKSMIARRRSCLQQLGGVDSALWEKDRWQCIKLNKLTNIETYRKDTDSTYPFNAECGLTLPPLERQDLPMIGSYSNLSVSVDGTSQTSRCSLVEKPAMQLLEREDNLSCSEQPSSSGGEMGGLRGAKP